MRLLSFEDEKFLLEEHIGYSSMTTQHFHEELEIYYLKQGEVAYFVDEAVYNISEGDVIIMPPTVIHKTVDTRHLPRHRILIDLPKMFCEQMREMGFEFWDSVSVIHTNQTERINQIFLDLLAEQAGERNPTLVTALVCELLILLRRKKESKESVVSDNAYSKQISAIIAYINQEYATDLTLEDISKRFFLNPSHLSRLFKKCTGMTFSDYLRKYRIKKAIELMEDSEKNITGIALAVGFNSTNHFCKTFRTLVNESPLKYKKQHLHRQAEKQTK